MYCNIKLFTEFESLQFKCVTIFKQRRKHMDMLNQVKAWAKGLADVGVSMIALAIVLEVLFNGQGVPFWPDMSVIANVQSVLAGLSDQGLLGLVAVWVLYHIYKAK
jgi:hypothetical protein